eukprot:scaffold64821_cov50-Attheya_sp.AAC.2
MTTERVPVLAAGWGMSGGKKSVLIDLVHLVERSSSTKMGRVKERRDEERRRTQGLSTLA